MSLNKFNLDNLDASMNLDELINFTIKASAELDHYRTRNLAAEFKDDFKDDDSNDDDNDDYLNGNQNGRSSDFLEGAIASSSKCDDKGYLGELNMSLSDLLDKTNRLLKLESNAKTTAAGSKLSSASLLNKWTNGQMSKWINSSSVAGNSEAFKFKPSKTFEPTISPPSSKSKGLLVEPITATASTAVTDNITATTTTTYTVKKQTPEPFTCSSPPLANPFLMHLLDNNGGDLSSINLEQLSNHLKTNLAQANTVVPKRLHIHNIPFSYTEANLIEMFREYGEIQDVQVIRDKDGNSKGYGFITLSDARKADSSKVELGGHYKDGRKIIINDATPPKYPPKKTQQQ